MRPIVLAVLLTAVAPVLATDRAAPVEPARASALATERRTADADADAVVNRHCLRETGTRIRSRDGRRGCAPVSGRVWTREDLERTGQTDVGVALRMLDVSIR